MLKITGTSGSLSSSQQSDFGYDKFPNTSNKIFIKIPEGFANDFLAIKYYFIQAVVQHAKNAVEPECLYFSCSFDDKFVKKLLQDEDVVSTLILMGCSLESVYKTYYTGQQKTSPEPQTSELLKDSDFILQLVKEISLKKVSHIVPICSSLQEDTQFLTKLEELKAFRQYNFLAPEKMYGNNILSNMIEKHGEQACQGYMSHIEKNHSKLPELDKDTLIFCVIKNKRRYSKSTRIN